jgi:hypothetical protein
MSVYCHDSYNICLLHFCIILHFYSKELSCHHNLLYLHFIVTETQTNETNMAMTLHHILTVIIKSWNSSVKSGCMANFSSQQRSFCLSPHPMDTLRHFPGCETDHLPLPTADVWEVRICLYTFMA